jgi:hypothetical protein
MGDGQDEMDAGFRNALDGLITDYALRAGEPGFDADAYFVKLRRLVQAGAQTVVLVAEEGAMGGGGQDES